MRGNWRIRDSKIVLVCGVLWLVPPLAIHSSYPSNKTLFFLPNKFVKFQFCPGFVRSCLGKAQQFVTEQNCFHLVQVPWSSFFTQILISELVCPCPLFLWDSPFILYFFLNFLLFSPASISLLVGFWSDCDGTGMKAGRQCHRRLPLNDSALLWFVAFQVLCACEGWKGNALCSTAPFAKRRIQFKRKRYSQPTAKVPCISREGITTCLSTIISSN